MAVRAEVHHRWAVTRGNNPDDRPYYCPLHEARYGAAVNLYKRLLQPIPDDATDHWARLADQAVVIPEQDATYWYSYTAIVESTWTLVTPDDDQNTVLANAHRDRPPPTSPHHRRPPSHPAHRTRTPRHQDRRPQPLGRHPARPGPHHPRRRHLVLPRLRPQHQHLHPGPRPLPIHGRTAPRHARTTRTHNRPHLLAQPPSHHQQPLVHRHPARRPPRLHHHPLRHTHQPQKTLTTQAVGQGATLAPCPKMCPRSLLKCPGTPSRP